MNRVHKCVWISCILVAFVVKGHEYIWQGGHDNDSLTSPANWSYRGESGMPTQPPGAGDTIWVAIEHPMTLNAADDESLDVLNSVDSVNLAENTSRFTITVPTEVEATVSVPVWGGYGSGGRGDSSRGNLTIQGGGTLHLASRTWPTTA